jgi:hypothetical protein
MLPERFLIAGVEQACLGRRASRIASRTKAMTGMWITSSQTAARKLGGCVSEHQIENLDNFPRIKLVAYFEDEPLYPLRTASARCCRVYSAKRRLSSTGTIILR